MAIALNRGNINSARTSTFGGYHANVVPSATVWEPTSREVRVNNVRTLNVPSRTAQRSVFEQDSSMGVNSSRNSSSASASVRSNIALGAIFGAAVFIGTIFAGTTALEEPVVESATVSSSSQVSPVVAR